MTAIRSIMPRRTEGMPDKPAFRGCRAIVAAAATIACGLLAAPLQADHVPYGALVEITGTAGSDGQVTLDASIPGFVADPSQQTDFQFRMRGSETTTWDDEWFNMVDGNVTVTDFIGYGTSPYSFQARAWNMRKIEGEWHLTYSPPSGTITVSVGTQ